MASEDKERLYKLALDEAERTIAQQQAVLEQIRTRAVGLVAVGSGVATFTGVRTDRVGITGFSLVAYLVGVAAYIGSVVLAALILLPSDGWKFAMDAETITKTVDTKPDAAGEYTKYVRQMANWTEANSKDNQKKLATRINGYTVGLGLLGLQVVCWLIAARR